MAKTKISEVRSMECPSFVTILMNESSSRHRYQMTVPRSPNEVEWNLRYGEPTKKDHIASASIISSYAYLLGAGITTEEAINRLRVMRK